MDLLVHITAPSSRRDDDRYKRQARAYSSFESNNDITVHQVHVATSRESKTPKTTLGTTRREKSSSFNCSPSVFLEESQLARTALESQLVTSSLGQVPCLPQFDVRLSSAETPVVQDSSVVGISQRTSFAPAPLDQSRSKIRRTSNIPSPTEKRPRASYSPFARPRGELSIGPTEQKQSLSSDDIPSQLPSTYSLSDETQRENVPLPSPIKAAPYTPSRRSGRAHYNNSTPLRRSSRIKTASVTPARSVAELQPTPGGPATGQDTGVRTVGKLLASPLPAETLSTNGSGFVASPTKSSASNLRGTSKNDSANSGRALPEMPAFVNATESMIAMPPPPQPSTSPCVSISKTPGKPGEATTMRTLTFSIHPNLPPTSCGPFSSHVTPELDALLRFLPKNYRPKRVLRSPRQSERGHWLLDTSQWSIGIQIRFWRFLEQHIKSGKSGWGVWCTREARDKSDTPEKGGTISGSLGKVQIFCWGEVVHHIYLMLYVASDSKIRKITSAWIDADGEAIIQM